MNKQRIRVYNDTEANTIRAELTLAGNVILEDHIQPEIVSYTAIETVTDKDGTVTVTKQAEPIYEKRRYLNYTDKAYKPVLSIETLDLRLQTLESRISKLEVPV